MSSTSASVPPWALPVGVAAGVLLVGLFFLSWLRQAFSRITGLEMSEEADTLEREMSRTGSVASEEVESVADSIETVHRDLPEDWKALHLALHDVLTGRELDLFGGADLQAYEQLTGERPPSTTHLAGHPRHGRDRRWQAEVSRVAEERRRIFLLKRDLEAVLDGATALGGSADYEELRGQVESAVSGLRSLLEQSERAAHFESSLATLRGYLLNLAYIRNLRGGEFRVGAVVDHITGVLRGIRAVGAGQDVPAHNFMGNPFLGLAANEDRDFAEGGRAWTGRKAKDPPPKEYPGLTEMPPVGRVNLLPRYNDEGEEVYEPNAFAPDTVAFSRQMMLDLDQFRRRLIREYRPTALLPSSEDAPGLLSVGDAPDEFFDHLNVAMRNLVMGDFAFELDYVHHALRAVHRAFRVHPIDGLGDIFEMVTRDMEAFYRYSHTAQATLATLDELRAAVGAPNELEYHYDMAEDEYGQGPRKEGVPPWRNITGPMPMHGPITFQPPVPLTRQGARGRLSERMRRNKKAGKKNNKKNNNDDE